MALVKRTFIGKGIPFLREVGQTTSGLEDAGNCSKCTFGFEEEEKTIANFRTAGGGDYSTYSRFRSVSIEAVFHDFNASNYAKFFRAANETVAAGAVTDETKAGYLNALVPTDFLIDTTVTPVVTGTGGTPSFTLGTHFTVDPTGAGINIIAAPGGWTSGQNVLIDYTKKASSTIQALVNSGKEYELLIAGLNEAESGIPHRLWAYKWKPGVLAAFDVIGDEYGGITVRGKINADTSITTANKSQYFKIDTA